MPRSSDGAYSLPSGSLVNIGEDIVPSQHNPPLQDIAQALSDSLSRDGRGGMRSNLDMGGFKARNLAPGTQPNDAATVSQIGRSEEHTSELQSLMRISYAVFCLKKKKKYQTNI